MTARRSTPAAAELYARANAAYRDGHNAEAIALFRDVLALQPRKAKARTKLAGLLHHEGRAHQREEHTQEALTRYREAYLLAPDLPKLRPRLTAALCAEAGAALLRDDTAGARADLREALEVTPGDRGATRMLAAVDRARRMERAQAKQARLAPRARHTRLPQPGAVPSPYPVPRRLREALRTHLPPLTRDGAELADLVIVEDGVNQASLRTNLWALDGFECFSERRLRLAQSAGVQVQITPLLEVGSVGLSDDARLCQETDALARVVRVAVRRALPPRLRTFRELDLIDQLAFEFDDATFAAGLRLRNLDRLLSSGRYGRVVLVVGNARLSRAMLGAAETALGAEQVFLLWCSPSQERYDQRPVSLPDLRRRDGREPFSDLQAADARAARPSPRPVSALRAAAGRLRARPTPGATGRIALLAVPSARHVGNVAPIARKLLADTAVVALLSSTAARHLEEYGAFTDLAAEHPDRFAVDPRLGVAAAAAARASWLERRALRRALGRVGEDPRIGGLALGGAPLWPVLAPAAERLLTTRLPAVRRFAAEFDRFLAEERPRGLVVSPDRTSEARIACALARRAGVPSVFPQVFFFSTSPRYKRLQSDYITVVDDFTRDLYVSHLRTPQDRVLVTGVPRFDAILDRRGPAAARVTDPEQRCVLLVLQRFSRQYNDALIALIAEAVQALGGVRLVVKMHPGEPAANREHYTRLAARPDGSQAFAVRAAEDLYDMIAAADLVVSAFSNVVLEAAMLARLVLCVNLTGEPLPIPFVEQGAAVGAESPDQVRTALARCLGDPAFIAQARERQREYFALNDHLLTGRADDRIASFLLELAGRGTR